MNPATLRANILRVALRTIGVGAVDLMSQAIRVFATFTSMGWTDRALMTAEIGRNSLFLGFSLALALEIHESPAFRHDAMRRWSALVLAAALAVIASSLAARSNLGVSLGITASEHALRMHALWNNGIVALVTVAYLTRRRESREAEQRRLGLASRLRQAQERLTAIAIRTEQSRVAPQTMFDCLIRARDVYFLDLERGDALLDKLTKYFRLTLGLASDTEATLLREAELAAAWIDVERCDADAPMELRVASAVEGVRFPAGVLGPLAHEWLQDPVAAPPRALRLRTDHDHNTLRVWLEGPCPVPEAALKRAVLGLQAFSREDAEVIAEANSICLKVAFA